MIAQQIAVKDTNVQQTLSNREDKVHPMWSADEDERRIAIMSRAAAGARKALAGKS